MIFQDFQLHQIIFLFSEVKDEAPQGPTLGPLLLEARSYVLKIIPDVSASDSRVRGRPPLLTRLSSSSTFCRSRLVIEAWRAELHHRAFRSTCRSEVRRGRTASPRPCSSVRTERSRFHRSPHWMVSWPAAG